MTSKKFYTQEQIDNAKLSLSDLPDLTPNRISREDMLASLSQDIVTLSTEKGYSAADIKKALENLEISVSEKAITEVIRKNSAKSPRSRRKSKTENVSSSTDQ